MKKQSAEALLGAVLIVALVALLLGIGAVEFWLPPGDYFEPVS